MNLLANPGAEAGPGSPDDNKVAVILGWKVSGPFNVVRHGAQNGYPAPTVSGSADRGQNFFAGGPDNAESSAMQVIDVSNRSGAINAGKLTCHLSGYLGGYQGQNDNATLTAEFQGADAAKPGAVAIGPLLAAERKNVTGLFLREASTAVPVGTRRIIVTLRMVRAEGSSNDGYPDNLSLTLARNASK